MRGPIMRDSIIHRILCRLGVHRWICKVEDLGNKTCRFRGEYICDRCGLVERDKMFRSFTGN
jgi:hypothetical protein